MILGLTGKKQSGKDTIAKYLVKEHGFVSISFAGKLKESASALFDTSPEFWDRAKLDDTYRISVSDGIGTFRDFSAREFLQRYETESHRDIFGYDFWVDELFKVANRYRDKNIVIPDVRFNNEASRIVIEGGFVVKLIRPGTEDEDNHISEAGVSSSVIRYTVINEGTLEQLYQKISTFLFK